MKKIFEELLNKFSEEAMDYADVRLDVDKDTARRIVTEALGAAGKVLSDTYGRGPDKVVAVLYERHHDKCDIKRRTNVNGIIRRISDIMNGADLLYDREAEEQRSRADEGVTEQSRAIDALIIKNRIEDITADIIAGYVDEGVTSYIREYIEDYDLFMSDYIDHYHYHEMVLQALLVREQAARMHGDELEIERVKDAREWISDMRGLSRLPDGTIVNELYA